MGVTIFINENYKLVVSTCEWGRNSGEKFGLTIKISVKTLEETIR